VPGKQVFVQIYLVHLNRNFSEGFFSWPTVSW